MAAITVSKAALLIDWENLLGRLVEDPWWVSDPAPLIPRIVHAVQTRTEQLQPSVPLEYKGYFLQAGRTMSLATGHMLVQNNVKRTESTAAKNAADTRLIVKATRLQREGYTRFFVVTGDEDFADLAYELESEGGAEVYLWPVDRTRLRGPIQDWHRKEYVAKAIGLTKGTPPSADDLDQFVLYLQRLIDGGKHLGDWATTLERVGQLLEVADPGRCEVLWGQVHDAGYIWEGKEVIGGKVQRRRRLKYEHAKVMRLLYAVDLVLDQIEHDHGSSERSKLMSVLPDELRVAYPALVPMLVASQHLTLAGSSVSCASRAASLGTLRPLRRMILSTWHQSMLRPEREGVAPGLLAKRWLRHATRGARDVKPEIAERHLKDGSDVVRRCEAAGALLPVGGRGKPFGYVVNDNHPLVEHVKTVTWAIYALLPADAGAVPRPALNDMLAATAQTAAIGATSSDRRFWLGALASEQAVRMFDGKVARNQNSPLNREASP